MDKKTFAQFLLASALVLAVWWGFQYLFLRPEPRPHAGRPMPAQQPAPAPQEEPPAEATEATAPEPAPVQPEQGPEPVEGLVLANERLRTEWTNVGAALQRLQITDEKYKAPYKVGEERPPLTLLKDFQQGRYSDAPARLTLSGERGGRAWRTELPIDRLTYRVVQQTPDRIVFEGSVTDRQGHRLDLRKTIEPGAGYHMTETLEVLNAGEAAVEAALTIRGPTGIERETLDTRHLGTRIGVLKGDDYDVAKRSAGELRPEDDEPNNSAGITWAGLVNHYFFAAMLLEEEDIVDQVASVSVIEEDLVNARGRWNSERIRNMNNRRKMARNAAVLIRTIPFSLEPGQSRTVAYRLVAAPKVEEVLEPYGAGLEQVVDLGLLPSISRLALVVLNLIYSVIPNYGIAIILLTAFVRVILHPLTRKSQMSMAKMQKLQPEIAELQKQFGDDREKLAQEQMKLWRKYGVSPLSGCGPLLLQLPVLIALFGALRAAIELRHAGFLWVDDLSRPDTLFRLPFTLPILGDAFNLLPLFMAAAMLLNQQFTPDTGTEQGKQQQKIMKWLPLFFVVILYNFPSGLCLYLTVSTSIGLVERWLITKKAAQIELKPVAETRREKRKEKKRGTRVPPQPAKEGWLDKLRKFAEKHAQTDQQAKSDKKQQ
ncbi:MAG: membrane protein insertase YidC [Candidatus Brocadiia bacterium]